MLRSLQICTALTLAMSSAPSLAQDCIADTDKFRVVFANGILASPEDARRGVDALRNALGDTYHGQAIAYDVAYNQTDNIAIDLVQAAEQKHIESFRELMMALDEGGLLPDWAVDVVQRALSVEHTIVASGVLEHVEKYREAILQGQKVLVVAHSQGNFYANEAYLQLSYAQPRVPLESIGILALATPSGYVAGGGQYLTHDRDIISTVPLALRPNWTLLHSSDNSEVPTGELSRVRSHFFETYLAFEYNVRAEVVRRAHAIMSTLVDPPQVVRSGPVTVTMTWNLGDSDVDLHVLEPSGAHVYYASKYGFSGFLDKDDIVGYGPEHYYTDCSQLKLGEYIVGLNYFDDHEATVYSVPVRPATAAVTVSVPGATRTFYRQLEQHWGVAGNSSPVRVARIMITQPRAPEGELLPLQYSIESLY